MGWYYLADRTTVFAQGTKVAVGLIMMIESQMYELHLLGILFDNLNLTVMTVRLTVEVTLHGLFPGLAGLQGSSARC